MSLGLVISYCALIALFGAAGSQFIMAHLAAQKAAYHAEEQGKRDARARWGRFRFGHLAHQAQPLPPGQRRRLAYGFAFLLAGLLWMAVILWLTHAG